MFDMSTAMPLDVFENLACPGVGDFPLRTDAYPPRGAMEQGRPETLFEQGNPFAYVGRRYAEFLGRRDKARKPRDAAENPQINDLYIVHWG